MDGSEDILGQVGRTVVSASTGFDRTASPFEALKGTLDPLDFETSAAVLAASADIALVLTGEGVIRQAVFASDPAVNGARDPAAAGLTRENWVGKNWLTIVTPESRPKVEALLTELPRAGAVHRREINHVLADGSELPIRFSAIRLKKGGLVLAVGRSLAAIASLQQRLVEFQRSMERDYAKLRQAETRYRHLFQLAAEGILIVDGATRRIVEANPAAARLVGEEAMRLAGRAFADLVDPEVAPLLEEFVLGARGAGRAGPLTLPFPGAGRLLVATASVFRIGAAVHLLVRLSPPGGDNAASPTASSTLEVVDRLPDGFVVTDLDRRILEANRAFLDLAELATVEQARGQPIERWLGRAGADFNVLSANLRTDGIVRDFGTALRGEFGSIENVEVSAVAVPDGQAPCYGFVIRNVGRRPDRNPFAGARLPRSADQLADLVGRMSLKEIVRETADVIEKLCVEAALKATGDNRASAAQILGLSRQSLYAKLRRYGIDDVDPGEEE